MSEQEAKSTAQVFDVIKQVLSAIFVAAGVTAFYYFPDIQLLYRVLALVAVIGVSLGMVLTTSFGRGVGNFILESKQEVRKIVWPTREETFKTTGMVFLMAFLVGVVLWCLDMALFQGIRFLTGQVE